MDAKELLSGTRQKIDTMDDQIMNLFRESMKMALEARELNHSNNISLVYADREKQAVERANAHMVGRRTG